MTDHIKIYGVKPRIQYVADGSLTVYEFPFAIFQTSDIEVYFADVKQASTTYTVSMDGLDGGSVTFETAPISGTVITIVRNLSIERTSDFQEGATLRAKVLNDELDYQIACQQQIAENLNRSMVLPPYATDEGVDLTLPMPSAGKAIVWTSDVTNLENSTVQVNALESTLNGYKTAAETAASTATTKAGIASDKADIATSQAQTATTQAGIATEKAAEVAASLSTKANKDMDNLSTTGKTNVMNLCLPDWSAGIDIALPLSTSKYTCPSDGIYCCCFLPTATNTLISLYVNGTKTAVGIHNSSTGNNNKDTISAYLQKGDKIYFDGGHGSNGLFSSTFYPLKGA